MKLRFAPALALSLACALATSHSREKSTTQPGASQEDTAKRKEIQAQIDAINLDAGHDPQFVAAILQALGRSPVSVVNAKPKGEAGAKPEPKGGAKAEAPSGWFNWRGPTQEGTSPETGLPDKIDAKNPLWTADFPGQSAPVIANGKLYINGYLGDGPDLQEGIACFDADTGKLLWKQMANDFLSDTVYFRYATSSPTIDRETGNIFVQATHGLLTCYSPDGKQLWQHSLMEEYGRLTFPNSRTATPIIDDDLVITRGIFAGWGANGPTSDRIFAFDKKTGELVWLSSPIERPQDNTFSPFYVTELDGQRVLISAAGDSSVICVNARTGDPIFRFPAASAGAKGGINGGVLRYKDTLLVVHESENVDTSEVGRTAAYRLPTGSKAPAPGKPQVYTPKELETWRNPLGTLASSPCLVGDTLYEVTGTGEFAAVNAATGEIKWRKKLGAEQRQSSPFYADGKVYVAFYIAGAEGNAAGESNTGNGELLIFKPGEKEPEILSRTKLVGRCFGSPIAYNGKLYVQTDKKLYAFGKKGDNAGAKKVEWKAAFSPVRTKTPATAKLQVIPNEVILSPGESVQVRVRGLASDGFVPAASSDALDLKDVKLDNFIPPTALVKAKMNGKFDDAGKLTADATRLGSAGAFQAVLTADPKVTGTMRGRVLQDLPIKIDFESYELKEMTGPGLGQEVKALPPAEPGKPAIAPGPTNWNVFEPPTAFAYPPLPWNAARFRFDIRKAPAGLGAEDNKALCKTIDNKLFQRGQIFVGKPDLKNYTIEADVLSEGNRRKGCDIGLINQRYLVMLKFNEQTIEVTSNQERIKDSVPFAAERNTWYHFKIWVDVAADGSGVVRAKAWKKADAEPEAWTLEYKHKTAHANGSPGFFCFTPQEQRAWIDNLEVKAN
jgi:outer membrane protein assembly factor BamB